MSACLARLCRSPQAICFATPAGTQGTIARMQIGMKIKRARMAAGLTQRELALRSGVSPGLVGQIESHRTQPGRETLRRLCDVLGITVDSALSTSNVVEFHAVVTSGREVRLLHAFRRLSRRQQDNLLELLAYSGDVAKEMQAHPEPAAT